MAASSQSGTAPSGSTPSASTTRTMAPRAAPGLPNPCASSKINSPASVGCTAQLRGQLDQRTSVIPATATIRTKAPSAEPSAVRTQRQGSPVAASTAALAVRSQSSETPSASSPDTSRPTSCPNPATTATDSCFATASAYVAKKVTRFEEAGRSASSASSRATCSAKSSASGPLAPSKVSATGERIPLPETTTGPTRCAARGTEARLSTTRSSSAETRRPAKTQAGQSRGTTAATAVESAVSWFPRAEGSIAATAAKMSAVPSVSAGMLKATRLKPPRAKTNARPSRSMRRLRCPLEKKGPSRSASSCSPAQTAVAAAKGTATVASVAAEPAAEPATTSRPTVAPLMRASASVAGRRGAFLAAK
mmetsp:Transcript_19913/g.76381  ORF Transcript_19913/g.76381 Transcript_19913/m.76381 type:complete len:364 (+) Transcript_19913:153-1244(+)